MSYKIILNLGKCRSKSLIVSMGNRTFCYLGLFQLLDMYVYNRWSFQATNILPFYCNRTGHSQHRGLLHLLGMVEKHHTFPWIPWIWNLLRLLHWPVQLQRSMSQCKQCALFCIQYGSAIYSSLGLQVTECTQII